MYYKKNISLSSYL